MHFNSLIEVVVYHIYNTIVEKISGYAGGAATPEEKAYQNLSDQGEQQFFDCCHSQHNYLAALVHKTTWCGRGRCMHAQRE